MAAAGLPGTGIGGLFYVVAGLLSPFRHVWRCLTGRPTTTSHRQVAGTALLALGVIAGIWAAGWLLGLVLPAHVLHLGTAAARAGAATLRPNAVRIAAVIAGFGTLVAVMGAVQVAHMVTRPRPSRRVPRHQGL